MNITDIKNIGVVMQVWAVNDDYDYNKEEGYISVTGLIKPLKSIILSARAPKPTTPPDIEEFISRALGNAVHASVEKAWFNYEVNLKKIGYPQEVIDMVIINPTPQQLAEKGENCIPVYIEQRATKLVSGFTVGGKFDFVAEGILYDNKTTSTFTWTSGKRDDEHRLQGSLYKWLNPDKITEDFIRINYLFTDWQKFMAKQKPTYPQSRVQQKDVILMTHDETQEWVEHKLDLIRKLWNAEERLIPDCTEEELWRSEPVYKYYANPAKTEGRSTKNFDEASEAYEFLASKGGVGVVKEIPGEVKRCNFCNAFEVCEQRKRYFPDPV